MPRPALEHAFALLAMASAVARASQGCRDLARHRILDTLVAARSEGVAGPFASAPDGEVLWVAESGSILVIADATDPGQYAAPPQALVPIGRQRVIPVEMALDPRASAPYGDRSGQDYLYIAGGRSGLWGMRAIEDPTRPAAVTRLDDRHDLHPPREDSLRWCSALEFARFADDAGMPIPYLLVLFGGRDDSRLRVYELEDLRAAIGCSPDETACEVPPVAEFTLARHPQQQDPTSVAYAFGMSAHQVGARRVDVYVAMGGHGIHKLALQGTSAGRVERVPGSPPWGPVFGDGSAYALADPLYDHLHYAHDREGHEYGAHPPLFSDLTLARYDLDGQPGAETVLLAAVDHLGWVAFDVTAEAWGPSLPVIHHEGVRTRIELRVDEEGPVLGDDVVCLVPAEPGERILTWSRKLSLIEHEGRPVLAVTSSRTPLARDPGRLADGSVLSPHFEPRNGIFTDARTDGTHAHTTLYVLDAQLVPFALNQRATTHSGGDEVVLFPRQRTEHPEQVEFFAARTARIGSTGFGNATLRQLIDFTRPQVHTQFLIRDAQHRFGHFGHVLGSSGLNPDVLLRSHNDGNVLADGIYVHCGERIERFHDQRGNGDDNGGSFGVFLNPRATWPGPGEGDEYVWGAGRSPRSGVAESWTLYRFHPGDSVCQPDTPDPPHLRQKWHFRPPRTRFGNRARNYWMGTIDREYDQENDSGRALLFATCGGDPHALYAFDRGYLEQWAEARPGALLDLDDPSLAPALLARLETDPEYANVPDSSGAGSTGHRFLLRQGWLGRTESFAPHLFRLPSDAASVPDTWVMAVPCGPIYFPRDAPLDPALFPALRYVEASGHALVRFWNVQDPEQLADGLARHDPFAELIGPSPEAAAIDVECAESAGRVFAFVADHGGRVLAYDVTDLLLVPSDDLEPLDVWVAPPSLWDGNANTIRSIVVDRSRWSDELGEHDELYVYAGVQRVGIQVLRWCAAAGRFEEVALVQTPGNANFVELRVDERDPDHAVKTLLVADGVGVRILGYGF